MLQFFQKVGSRVFGTLLNNHAATAFPILVTANFSDSVDLNLNALVGNMPSPASVRGFIPLTEGSLRVNDLDGAVRSFLEGELTVGQVYPLCIRRIHATGTTLTRICILV
jgi:hypothetical protein